MVDLDQFEIFYPGQYTNEEAEALGRLQEELKKPAEVSGPMAQDKIVTEEDILRFNQIWSPLNPFYTDPNYAGNQGGITSFPCYAETIGRAPMLPKELGDNIPPFVPGPQIPGGLFDNEIQQFVPIHPGDTLTVQAGERHIEDITPEGGVPYRVFRCVAANEMYNQNGELVIRGIAGGTTGLVRYKDGHHLDMSAMPVPDLKQGHFSIIRGEPHSYTAEDYEYIKDLWAKEKIRGAQTLYWDDVQIGDEPVWTCDGPTTATDLISYHNPGSMGVMMIRKCMTENQMFGLVKDPYGMYYHDTAMHYCNLNIPNARPYHFNSTCRNQILRMVTNWMGDDGQVRAIGWRLGEEQKPEEAWNKWPEGFARESWLLKVPALKQAGKFMSHHAMVGDVSICKGYVYDKYEENGEFFAEMACWTETIEGYITQECRAVVKLPKKA